MFHVEHCFCPKTPRCVPFHPHFDPLWMFHVEHWGSFSTLRFFGEARQVQYQLGPLEPGASNYCFLPAVLAAGWWFTQEHASPRSHQCRRVLQGCFVWAKPARHHRIKSFAPLVLPGERTYVGADHPHSVAPTQRRDGSLECIGAFGSAVNQGDVQLGPQLGNH